MKNRSDTSLTKVLIDLTKWSGKMTFFAFIIGGILLSITLSSADPTVNYSEISLGQSKTVYSFSLNQEKTIQFGFSIDDDTELNKIHFRIVKKAASIANEDEDIAHIIANSYLKEFILQAGEYKIIFENPEFVTGASSVSVIFGTGSFNYGLVGATILAIVVFSISSTIFWFALICTSFLLVINAVVGSVKPQRTTSAVVPPRQKRDQEVTPAYVSDGIKDIQPTKSFDLEAIFGKFQRSDWIIFSIGVLFFFGFLAEPQSPFLVFAILVFIGTIYMVTEREKTKHRIIVLLSRYRKVNMDFLVAQMDKKKKHIVSAIKIMMLDEGLPIRMDTNQNYVEVVGDLTSALRLYDIKPTSGEPISTVTSAPIDPISVQDPIAQPVVTTPTKTKSASTTPAERLDNEPSHFCSTCGELLVSSVKYCYSCGAKQHYE